VERVEDAFTENVIVVLASDPLEGISQDLKPSVGV
jgi:hypothetical protein